MDDVGTVAASHELVGTRPEGVRSKRSAPAVADSRICLDPGKVNGRMVLPRTGQHHGYKWLVLSGRTSRVMGERNVVVDAGEAAELDFGRPGERMQVRARSRRAESAG